MNRCYECESVITLVCQNCNTRPTPARCDELETVGWLWEYAQYRTDDRGYYGYETVITESNPTDHVSPAEKLRNVRELVTRQNAEEVIAAERMKLEATARVGLQLSEKIEELEADNASLIHDLNRIKDHDTEMVNDSAAKDVRIAELEAKLETANALVTCCCGSLVNDHDMGSGHSPVDQYHYAMVQLESDNKRLREALERIADWPNGGKNYGQENIKRFARTALRGVKP